MLRCLRPVTRMVLFTVLCVLIALPIACSAESAAAGQAVPVSGITLSETEIQVVLGTPAALTAAVQPENAANTKIEWISSDESVATVQKGKIKGISAGKCEIICKASDGSDIQAACAVEVVVPVKSAAISEKQTVLLIGAGSGPDTAKLTCTVKPENAYWQDVTWTSSDEKIATVDAGGTVRGIAPGKVTITASSTQPGSKVKAQARVTVTQAVTGIRLRNEELYLPLGKPASIKAAVEPENAGNKKLEWISSDETVVRVSRDGKATAVSVGDAVITARAADGSGTEASCKVRVGEDPYDDGYREGLELKKEGKFYSAREAFRRSRMADAQDMAQKCAQVFPKTGELWHNKNFKSSEMYLLFSVEQADPSTGMYINVYSENNELASTLFIRGVGKARTKLPGGRYRIRDATGTEWFGEKETFGQEGHYELMTFREIEGDEYLTDLEKGYEWTISINIVSQAGTAGSTGVGQEETDWNSWAVGTP